MTDLTVVTVAYRSRVLIEALLDRLQGLPIVVADNSADAEDLRALIATHPRATHLDLGGNVGFAMASNAGAEYAGTEYVAFVNPDARPSTHDLGRLVSLLREDTSIGAVGPALVDDRGSLQPNAGGWDIGIGRALVHALGCHRLFDSAGIWASASSPKPLAVDWVAGTCLVAQTKAFLDSGGFDESYFLYQEDVELGKRLRKLGYGLFVDGRVRVNHEGGGSSNATSALTRHRLDSLVRHIRRHNSPVRASAIALILAAGSLGRAAGYTVLGRRTKAAEQRWFGVALVQSAFGRRIEEAGP